jgi:hypothetical protein
MDPNLINSISQGFYHATVLGGLLLVGLVIVGGSPSGKARIPPRHLAS